MTAPVDIKMVKLVVVMTALVSVCCLNLKIALLASILPNARPHPSVNVSHLLTTTSTSSPAPPPMSTTLKQQVSSSTTTMVTPATTTTTTTSTTTTTTTISSYDPNLDLDEPSSPQLQSPQGPNSDNPNTNNGTTQSSNTNGAGESPPGDNDNSTSTVASPPADKTQTSTTPSPTSNTGGDLTANSRHTSADLSIVFYSLFIVYVSFVKLFYHNVHFIKHNLTEPGILMLFGIFWQLVTRQLTPDHQLTFPRFNSRIFFYLFLPSTVLESASLLSNKWLFFNLLPILTHSIIGTVLYASAMGFTIYSLAHSNIFTTNWLDGGGGGGQFLTSGATSIELTPSTTLLLDALWSSNSSLNLAAEPSMPPQSRQQPEVITTTTTNGANSELSNLTLADCLIFGTILSSIDAAPMLNVFKQYQVNEKLYYLVLGESLMNNAVVIMIFNLLIEFFQTTRLTVVKIYIAILQFFANLIGGILIGFALALLALVSVRLTKRLQLTTPHVLSSYQNQCQAMVETLLILKLAYLTYTLSNLAGTSNIVSLATFGVLNEQYIKHNLNLRSQLAFRQVILAMKTMGFSLVYPLLGMLLVDTALNNEHHHHHHQHQTSQAILTNTAQQQVSNPSARMSPLNMAQVELSPGHHSWQLVALNETSNDRQQDMETNIKSSASETTKRMKKLMDNTNQQQQLQTWNFKFLSIVVILTIVYRFLIVIALGLTGNLLTCGQIKIKFKEQILMAYGGFKGPLSIALVHSLIEHSDHKERMMSTKHLFKYTILFNIFISAVLAGTFTRPLVARIQSTLIGRHLSAHLNLDDEAQVNSTIVFEQINYKLTECVSQGLNSILGHSRSPYDKFIEFNETHIKRWLVRGDNPSKTTNWLSVFYDNLVLDETLNANCFHIATDDPTTMRTQRAAALAMTRATGAKLPSFGNLAPFARRKRSSVSFLMDTISENISKAVGAVAPSSSIDESISGKQVVAPAKKQVTKLQAPPVGSDEDALRELVMLNVRQDEAKRRRRHQALAIMSSAGSNGAASAMIDSSHSSNDGQNHDSAELRNKQLYLSELEARMGTSSMGGGGGEANYEQQQRRRRRRAKLRPELISPARHHRDSRGQTTTLTTTTAPSKR